MEIASRGSPRDVGKKAIPSRCGTNGRSSQKKAAKKKKAAPDRAMPPFIAPQLCISVERPPTLGNNWIHEIKFDGYRVQMRVEKGNVTLKTRKGLDWTPKFGAIAKAARVLTDCIVDEEIVALDLRDLPISPACRPPCRTGKPMT